MRDRSWFPAGMLPSRRIVPSVLVFLLSLSACDAIFPEDGEAIDRSTFIETQVELMLAAREAGTPELSEAQRDRILNEQGVTDEELQAFVAVHGADEAFMAEVWREVDEGVLEALGAEPEEFPESNPTGGERQGVFETST